ncbi:Mitogen-activated protein kinase kinase kinase 17 [Camellia lanceoleosa]|uniref:Mitogen-activated protein kinase kinase kinase 17 n=1 Tax=Camellia lanceoleosa TaxID=1840588 RepID=A0ACC0FMQ1_9ERIC|nr:Mitogen-activated protein kinase kinase kinase 17 [Camellia lanceoleosa]
MWKKARTLGRGSFGLVSLAISQPNDESKLNLPSLMAVKSAETFQHHSLQKESNLLTELNDCPNILRCYGSFISNDGDNNSVPLYNIILEYASGGSLANRINTSPGGLSDYEIIWYTKSILIGLSHIHKKGYVHCDIKPHNILLVGGSLPLGLRTRRNKLEQETVKIADFGLAEKAGKKRKIEGTAMYMAPESVVYREYESRTDIWSLGCTVLEMITGEPCWKCEPGAETCALLFRIGFTEQVPEVPSWVSKEGKDFLRKCLVRNPKSRWTADMLLGHQFVSSKIIIPVRELMKKY